MSNSIETAIAIAVFGTIAHRFAWPSAPGRGCISLQIPDPPLAFGQGGSIVVSK